MITTRGHHMSLCVSDIAESRKFYGDLLGLSEIARPEMGLPGAWYAAGGVELHLIQAPDGVDTGTPAPSLNPIAGHLAFEIDDYESVLETLKSNGFEVLETNATLGQMWVHDPDRNIIEFILRR